MEQSSAIPSSCGYAGGPVVMATIVPLHDIVRNILLDDVCQHTGKSPPVTT